MEVSFELLGTMSPTGMKKTPGLRKKAPSKLATRKHFRRSMIYDKKSQFKEEVVVSVESDSTASLSDEKNSAPKITGDEVIVITDSDCEENNEAFYNTTLVNFTRRSKSRHKMQEHKYLIKNENKDTNLSTQKHKIIEDWMNSVYNATKDTSQFSDFSIILPGSNPGFKSPGENQAMNSTAFSGPFKRLDQYFKSDKKLKGKNLTKSLKNPVQISGDFSLAKSCDASPVTNESSTTQIGDLDLLSKCDNVETRINDSLDSKINAKLVKVLKGKKQDSPRNSSGTTVNRSVFLIKSPSTTVPSTHVSDSLKSKRDKIWGFIQPSSRPVSSHESGTTRFDTGPTLNSESENKRISKDILSTASTLTKSKYTISNVDTNSEKNKLTNSSPGTEPFTHVSDSLRGLEIEHRKCDVNTLETDMTNLRATATLTCPDYEFDKLINESLDSRIRRNLIGDSTKQDNFEEGATPEGTSVEKILDELYGNSWHKKRDLVLTEPRSKTNNASVARNRSKTDRKNSKLSTSTSSDCAQRYRRILSFDDTESNDSSGRSSGNNFVTTCSTDDSDDYPCSTKSNKKKTAGKRVTVKDRNLEKETFKPTTKSTSRLPVATKNEVAKKDSTTYSFLSSLSAIVPVEKCDPSARIYRSNFKRLREELAQKLFELYNSNIFGMKIPANSPIEWSERLRGTAGSCSCKKITKRDGTVERSVRITLASKVIDSADRLRDTLVHEMCHAATWIVNQVSDGHGQFWKSWAARAMNVYPELPPIERCHRYDIMTKYTYKCGGCGYSIGRHKKSLDIERKRCGHCMGKFEILINKITKSGEVKSVPATPKKEATGFALFVKENYATFKSPQLKHGDVMRILGEKFSDMKVENKAKT